MRIFQGTISSEYRCRPFMEGNKPVGLLFYKNQSDALFALVSIIGISLSLFIWYSIGFKAFVASIIVLIALFIGSIIRSRKNDEYKGIKYLIKDIQEVKVLENETMSSFAKSGPSSLAGAAVGGALLGGAGAVVGSIAAGNKHLKEQIVRLGVKFEDANWVVLETQIDETMSGKINKSNLQMLLDMTSFKQTSPF